MNAWTVTDGAFELPSGVQMYASCKHRPKGACGGCYARLFVAIESAAESGDPKAILRQVLEALQQEKR